MADTSDWIVPPSASPRPLIHLARPIVLPQLPQPPQSPAMAAIARHRPRDQPVPAQARVFIFDKLLVNLTGFYEAVPAKDDEHSAFTMQVNHAGKALIGWISASPDVVTGITRLQTLPGDIAEPRVGFVVLYAVMEQTPLVVANQREYWVPFFWAAFARPPENINTFDPKLWDRRDIVLNEREGKLRLETTIDPDNWVLGVKVKTNGLPQEKSWQITGINFTKDTQKGFDPLRLVRRRPRLPYSVVQQIDVVPRETEADPRKRSDQLRQALIAAQVCILPQSHIRKIVRSVSRIWIEASTAPQSDSVAPPTEAALNEWLAAGTASSETEKKTRRRMARPKVLDCLKVMATEIAKLRYPYHRELVRDEVNFHARQSRLGGGNDGEHYYDLYVQILDEEMTDHGEQAERDLEPILQWGIFPAVSSNFAFRYTLTFTKTIATTPPVWPVAVGLSTLDVKCEQVEFERDKAGKKKIDFVSGNPVIKTTPPPVLKYDTSSQPMPSRLTADIVALGIFPTTGPSTIELLSHISDLKYEDFSDATFSFVWIRGTPEVEIGPYANLKPLSTGLFNVTLPRRNDITLSGYITQLPVVEWKVDATGKKAIQTATTAPASLEDAKKKAQFVKPWVQDIAKQGPEAAAEGWLDSLKLKSLKQGFKNIVSISAGGGKFVTTMRIRTPSPKPDSVAAHLIDDTHTSQSSKIESFFNKDSTDFSEVVQGIAIGNTGLNISSRILLELFLALHLALIMEREARIDIVGHASPEGPSQKLRDEDGEYEYNDALSCLRAKVVLQAIRDAMKMFPDNAWTSQGEPIGKGESVARAPVALGGGGLCDPPGTENPEAFLKWLKSHDSEVRQWPRWRRVDLRIGGLAQLRLYD